VAAALSCGNGGGTLNLNPAGNGGGSGASAAAKSAGVLVTEDQIGSLPAWQQELLSDPGWNAPYIEPDPGTEIPAPTDELLWETTERELAAGLTLSPRAAEEAAAKGVSWNDQGGFTPGLSVARGEYASYTGVGVPPFGCNIDHANDYNSKNKGSEDAILGYPYFGPPQRISYVLRGTAANNHFVTGAAAGNNAANCVYQLFSSDENANPKDLNSTAQFAELSYRADKALDPGTHQPGAPGGTCPDAEAFQVEGLFWRKFNSDFNVLPNNSTTALYNVLIAPSSDVIGPETSSSDTVASYQSFYLGNQSGLFKGAQIVGLESSTGGCQQWQDMVETYAPLGFFHRPIYGVLLARWQDSTLPGMAGPWEGIFGWPVQGPVSLSPGVTLTARGSYYAWGMWFERGFIWWIDYNQTLNPGTPDEAQCYQYTGSNVYCKDGVYQKMMPTLYYGGDGDLGVSVSVDGMRYVGADPWEPVPFNESTLRYEIPLEDGGLDTVTLALHAQAWGGETDSEGHYKYYVWAFRDGSIWPAGPDYSDSNRYVTHTYGSTTQNLEGTYVVRVQVTDASFDNGSTPAENRAFGDSFPIVLGHGTGGGPAEVLIIQNDGGAYPTNYTALKDTLDELGVSYHETTDVNTDPAAYKLVIWYQGGPDGTVETTMNTTFPNADRIWQITNANKPVLIFAQSVALGNYSDWFTNLGGTRMTNINITGAWAVNYGYTSTNWVSGTGDGSVYFYHHSGRLPASWTNNWIGVSTDGENYSGSGSSGYAATSVTIPATQISYRIAFTKGWMINFFCVPGIKDGFSAARNTSGSTNGASMSGGSLTTNNTYPGGVVDPLVPGHAIKQWHIGYPWATATFNGISGTIAKKDILKNLLVWFDPTISFDTGGSTPTFFEYEGDAEILSVMPSFFDGSGDLQTGVKTQTYANQVGYAGGGYPDQTGTNVYRTSPAAGNYVVTGNPNNDWVNANDVDFQYPWYGFVYDPDASLTTAPEQVSGDEVYLGYDGLVVEDTDTVWTRVSAVAWFDPDFVSVAGWDEDLLRPTAGYYATTLDVVGTPALDTALKANYGSDVPALTDWDNKYPLMAEAVAHWVEDDYPGPLQWSMFPGHGLFDPATGDEIPWDADYFTFMRGFDIDPMQFVPNRDTPSTWYHQMWNRGQFTTLSSDYGGRYVEWDMRRVRNWNGDLNGDGNQDALDKFPVRCRLLLNPAPAAGNWPDHEYNPGSAPSGGVISTDGDFIEGGAYVVDNGTPLYVLDIYDDPATPDPNVAGQVVWQGGETFEVKFGYGIRYGAGPYTVELDVNYNGATFGDDNTGDGYNEIYTLEPVQPGNTLVGGPGLGIRTGTATITYPMGSYYFALRVTDSLGEVDTLWYFTNMVALQQYVATSPWLIVDDADDAGSDALEANFIAIAPATPWGAGMDADRLGADDAVLNISSTVTRNILNQYDVVIWNSGDASATCSLTDAQATAANNAMNLDGVMFFYTKVNLSSASGTSNQNLFSSNVSGLYNGYSTYYPWNDSLVANAPITSGPGGVISVLNPANAASDIYQSNFMSGTSMWGREGGYTSYWWITKRNSGIGKGIWIGCRWSGITSTEQKKFLHNMLYQLDPVNYPYVAPPPMYHENFEATPTGIGDTSPNTIGGFPNGDWTIHGTGTTSTTPDWDFEIFASNTHPYWTGVAGANGTGRFVAWNNNVVDYGYSNYRLIASKWITVTPGTAYNLSFKYTGNTESGYDYIILGVSDNASFSPTAYYDRSPWDYYAQWAGSMGSGTWQDGACAFTAPAGMTQLRIVIGFFGDVVSALGGVCFDEVKLATT